MISSPGSDNDKYKMPPVISCLTKDSKKWSCFKGVSIKYI